MKPPAAFQRTCRQCLAIVAGCAAIIAAAWFLTLERIAREREVAVAYAVRNNANLALAVEEQTVRTLQQAEQAMYFLKYEFRDDGKVVGVQTLVDESLLGRDGLIQSFIVDRAGYVLREDATRSPVNLADREYFAYHRAHADAQTRVAIPAIGRVTGRPVIAVSRRVDAADGSFDGVLAVGVDPSHLLSAYERFDLGRHGLVQLVGLDGVARARRAGDKTTFGDDMRQSTLLANARRAPAGDFVSAGRLEGVPRFISYRTLGEYPLVVAVGTSVDEALADFRERRGEYLATALASSLAAAFAALLLIVAVRRRERAMRALEASEELHRSSFEKSAVGIAHHALDGRFIAANPAYCRMVGYDAAELAQRTFLDLLHPDERAQALAQKMQLALGDALRTETRHIRKDGTVIWCAVSVNLAQDARGEPYLIAMAQDVTERRVAEEKAHAAEARNRATFEQAAIGMTHTSLDGRFFSANRRLAEILGYSEAELQGMRFADITHPDDLPASNQKVLDLLADRDAAFVPPFEKRYRRKDGSFVWANVAPAIVRDEAGKPLYFVTMVQDITSQHEAVARFRATFEQGAIGIVHASLDARVVKANRKFCSITGYDEAELVGRHVDDFTHPEDRDVSVGAARRLARDPDGVTPEYEKRYVCKDGSLRWVSVAISVVRKPDGAPDYVIGMVTDISARKRAEEMVTYQANYDALTGLPNRTLFQDRLAQTLSQAARHGWNVGVLSIDLDRFQAVNDTLGHVIGDQILQEAGKRLSHCVRGGDTVARIGGDGFAVIAADLAQVQDAGVVARKVIDAFAAPFTVDGHEVYLGASAGVAAFPPDGGDAATLMKHADVALARAKKSGRNGYQFYTAAMNERAVEKIRLEADLRRALERDEFRLHLQPKASLVTGRVVGFEALLRWQRPGNGLVPPGEFVPLLEQTGLIVPVGEWIVRAACAQLRDWRRAGLVPLRIAVNLAAKQFTGGDLVATVDQALAEHGVPGHLLEFEVTESDSMENPEAAVATLRLLKQRGAHIAIDDFGTGYSSLSYVKRFPVDTLKLDRSFVSGLPQDADDASIARAVITMAHSLGLDVVAEGVETAEQRDFLAERGCDQMQGYLLSRPLPPAEAARYLEPLAVAA